MIIGQYRSSARLAKSPRWGKRDRGDASGIVISPKARFRPIAMSLGGAGSIWAEDPVAVGAVCHDEEAVAIAEAYALMPPSVIIFAFEESISIGRGVQSPTQTGTQFNRVVCVCGFRGERRKRRVDLR